MNILTEQPDMMTLMAGPEDLNQVMVELDQLKRQSERLDLIYRLHRKGSTSAKKVCPVPSRFLRGSCI